MLVEAEARPVKGWDFSWLGDRMVTKPLPWSFEEIVLEHVRDSADLLDMGTGGGEWLAALPVHPPRTIATEGWALNVEVASERLSPLGIKVVPVEAAPDNVDQRHDEERGQLPFEAASFSLIVNRHESFVASEVARLLRTDGSFLTEQIGGDYCEFYDALGLPRPEEQSRWDLSFASHQLETAALRIDDGAEGSEEISFADAGALAWYLKAIPWIVEGFSVVAYRSQLERVHERIEAGGPITVRQPAFWVKAVKRSF